MIPSVFYKQDELLQALIVLHIDGETFDADPTFGKGNFYKNIKRPWWVSDINPACGVYVCCSTELPLPDACCESVMFDPPFLQKSGKGSVIKERFGEFKTIPILWSYYYRSLLEFYRILSLGGKLVFKCQDTVSCAKNWFTHVQIMNMALDAGFYPKDLFILVAKHRMPQWNLKKQQHARKYHSYFWVFEKLSASPINYGLGEIK